MKEKTHEQLLKENELLEEKLKQDTDEHAKHAKELKEKYEAALRDAHSQASLSASLTYRVYELEQTVKTLEMNLAGASAYAGGKILHVNYLESLVRELGKLVPDERRRQIEEEIRKKIYLSDYTKVNLDTDKKV